MEKSRRSFLKNGIAAGVAGGAFLSTYGSTLRAAVNDAPHYSNPSALKITGIKTAFMKGHGTHMFVKLSTNQGLVGYGEAMDAVRGTYGVASGSDGWDNMSQFLVGQNPLDVNKIFEQILRQGHFGGAQSGMFVAVLTGVETALWDLAGKALGLPVYRLMGGKFRDKIRLYCDGASSSESPEHMAEAALSVKNKGFTAIKFDIDWAGDPAKKDQFNRTASNGEINRMVKQVAAVREAIGMDMDLCLDAHGRYDLPSGIRIAKEMEPFKLLFLEEPIPAENLDSLREITSQTTTPICTGENHYLAHDFRKILELKAADIVMPDLQKCGGLGEGQRIANLANLSYVPVAPHMVASPLGAMAASHCCATFSNFLCLEWHWISRWDRWNELILEEPLIKDGYITVSDKPGIGVTLNEKAIKKFAVKDAPFF
ncbi:mandelate racemase/muconate lactonizing enzyme family protein [soil metagenome]